MSTSEAESGVQTRIASRSIDLLLGKAIVVVLFGTLLGYAAWLEGQGAFGEMPADEEEIPLVASVILTVLTVAFAAAAYELLGRAFGWIVGRVRRTLGS